MPTAQLIMLAVFGIAVTCWGARLDIRNQRKESSEKAVGERADSDSQR